MCAIVNDDNSLTVNLRYNETLTAKDFEEILYVANYARHGQDYMHCSWIALLQKHNMWL